MSRQNAACRDGWLVERRYALLEGPPCLTAGWHATVGSFRMDLATGLAAAWFLMLSRNFARGKTLVAAF